MATIPPGRATRDDLARTPGKAELIGGTIMRFPPSGCKPGLIAGQIIYALADFVAIAGRGEVFTSTLAYLVPEIPSGRESFSPDASYYLGPLPDDPMGFIEGPPTFAVEVREAEDFGPAAERAMAEKRADYFAAGTLVVWDVDPVAELIRAYRASEPDRPTTFAWGDVAEAEPAVPSWRIDVDAIFR